MDQRKIDELTFLKMYNLGSQWYEQLLEKRNSDIGYRNDEDII